MAETKKIRELDLITMAMIVIKEKKQLALYGFIGAVVGVLIALSIPKTYLSDTSLAPEFNSGSGMSLSGSLADLASSFGVDIGGGGKMDAIYPDLYPSIISSTDFLMDLYDVPVALMDDPSPRSYYHHIKKEAKFPFWYYPSIWMSELKAKMTAAEVGGEGNSLVVSKKDWEVIKQMRDMIICSVDRKSSVITIAVLDQDPLVAAAMADTVRQRLQDYIIAYRTNKAKLDIDYYTQLLSNAKIDYDKARDIYVHFADSHKSISTVSSRSENEALENDMQLKYSIYTQTSAMLKQAESKFQERMPAFTILQRPVTPMKPTNLPRSIVVLLFAFMGCAVCAVKILFFTTFRKDL